MCHVKRENLRRQYYVFLHSSSKISNKSFHLDQAKYLLLKLKYCTQTSGLTDAQILGSARTDINRFEFYLWPKRHLYLSDRPDHISVNLTLFLTCAYLSPTQQNKAIADGGLDNTQFLLVCCTKRTRRRSVPSFH